MYVLAQADSSSGLEYDFAVDTIDLSKPAVCATSFTSSTNVRVAATGALENATISSNTGCAFQASSNASWLQVVSGGYGSGDTTVSYVLRPNTGSLSRTGVITLNSGATLTVSQEGSAGAISGIVSLSVNPVAADYSKVLDKLVYVSSAPNELHLYDPESQTDTFVSLSLPPTSVSVDPTAMYAAVGHDGWISYVTLRCLAVQQIYPLNAAVYALSAADSGHIYAFAKGGPNAYYLNTSNSAVTPFAEGYSGVRVRLDEPLQYLYAADSWQTEWDVSQGTPNYIARTHTQAPDCGNIWISGDGNRIYTACATVYRASTNPGLAFTPEGSFSGTGSLTWAADSQRESLVAVIPANVQPWIGNSPLMDTQIQFYSNTDLLFSGQTILPNFQIGGDNYTGHGRYAFWNQAESNLIVVEQADSGMLSASNYGVYALSPTNLACSFSVNPTSITVPPNGFSAPSTAISISVSTPSGCSWYGQAQANWIYASNAFGSGWGSFTVTTSANVSSSTRTGTLSVAGQVVTFSQAPTAVAQIIAPSSTDFGSQAVGATSAPKVVTFENTSSVPISFTSIAASSSNGGSEYIIETNTCGAVLPAGASCTISVAYRPSTAEYKVGYLVFNDSALNSPHVVYFTRHGVIVPSVSLGNQSTGVAGPTQVVQLTNRGTQPIAFSGISLTENDGASDYILQSTTCNGILLPNRSCIIDVVFRPVAPGPRLASVQLSGASDPGSAEVLLSGTGLPYLQAAGSAGNWSVAPIPHTGDFDGDGKADFVIWRPSECHWYILPSSGNPKPFWVQQWGLPGDIPLTADFNGDKRSDFVVWRPSNGTWYVLFSNQASSWPPSIVQQWGLPGDIPVSGDFNGDGKADFAVWRPSNGSWYVLFSNQASSWPPSMVQQWGLPGDIPVPGDYDGDGKADFAVWRPSIGTWYIIPSSDPTHPITQQWGFPADTPVAADFDGDGKIDLAVWRPSGGNWYIIPSGNPTHPIVQQWGLPGDLPQIGDLSGQHKASFAIWRPSNTSWFVLNQKDVAQYPAPSLFAQWGVPDDIPM